METKKKVLILFIVLFLIILGCWGLLYGTQLIADESAHYTQVEHLIKGEYVFLRTLTVPPTYHFILTIIAKPLGLQSLDEIRLLNAILLSLLFIPIVYLISKSFQKTIQAVFFPTLFLYFVLIYTDIFSTTLILISYYLMTKQKYVFSALVGTLSIFVRQNNVFWILFILASKLLDDYLNNNVSWKDWSKYFPYAIGILSFMLYVLQRGAVVQGDASHHPISIHFGNIWMFLFTFVMCFLPYCLSSIPKIVDGIKNSWRNNFCLFKSLLLFVVAIGVLSFKNNHEYNQIHGVWFNELLMLIDNNYYIRLVFLLFVLFGVLVIYSIEFDTLGKSLWLIFTPIYLMFSWMIEVRYYFIPMIFLLLFIEYENTRIEKMATIYNILIALLWFSTIILNPL